LAKFSNYIKGTNMQRKCDKFNENNAPSDTVNKMATKDVRSATQTAGGLLTNNVFAAKSANRAAGSTEAAAWSANRTVGNGNRPIGSYTEAVESYTEAVKSAKAPKGSTEAAVRNAKLTVGSGGKSASNVTDQTAGVTPYRSNGMAEPRKRPRTISKAPISSVEPFGNDPLMRGRFVPDEIFGENYGEEYFDDEN
jgi:hypothetical protein